MPSEQPPRMKRPKGKQLQARNARRVERSFAHIYPEPAALTERGTNWRKSTSVTG